MSVAQVVTALTGFLTTIIVARLTGPEGVGAFSVALSILLVLGALASLGLENGIAWSVAAGRWAPRAALRQTQLPAALLGMVGMAIALAARLIAPDAFGGLSVTMTAVAAAGLPFLISWQYSRWLAAAMDRYEAFALPPALVSVLALVLCGVGAVVADVDGVIVGLLGAYVITAAVALVDAIRAVPREAGSQRGRAPLREATRFGLQANMANVLQLINFRIDLFVLSAVASGAELGRYATAVSVTSVMFLAPQTLAYIVFPRVAALSAQSGEEAERQRAVVEAKGLRHVSLLTLVSLPVLAVAMAIAVPLLYGREFDQAVVLGLILLPGAALYGIGVVLAFVINGRGFPGYSLRAALISTPPALVLYAVLIPWLDAYGAAIASTVSYALSFVVTAVYYRRATGDRVAPLLVPTREEVADLRALARRG
jgi:O-antigen/teichoic acid export membrane protein